MSYLIQVIKRIHAGDAVMFRQDYYGSNYISIKRRWLPRLPWWPRTWVRLSSQEAYEVKEALDKRRRARHGPET